MYEIQIVTNDKLITVYTQADSLDDAIYKACHDNGLCTMDIINTEIVSSKIAYVNHEGIKASCIVN